MIRKINHLPMRIAADARIAENATLVGELEIASQASVWYGAVLRGDAGCIRIGCRSAIEDNVTVHGSVQIGDDTVVGHNAVVHGCTVGNRCLIGMSATVLTGAVVGDGSLIAAGSLVSENTVIPPNSLVKGVPARVISFLSQKHRDYVYSSAEEYLKFSQMQLPLWDSVSETE